jgi:hypothetical protein
MMFEMDKIYFNEVDAKWLFCSLPKGDISEKK